MEMDIQQLRYFIAVVDHGSFSAASSVLNISQPSIGQQIRNLEEELETTLFNRHSRGTRVTGTGAKLEEYARDIIDRVDRAARAIRNEASDPSGEVRIGLTVSASTPLAVPMVLGSGKQYPHISLSITEALSHHLVEQILHGDLDLALAYVGEFPDGLRGEALVQEDFQFCVGANHPMAGETEVRMIDVLKHSLMLPPETHMLRRQVSEVAQNLGVDLKVGAVVQSVGTIADLVENDISAAILPYSAIAAKVALGKISAATIIEPTLTRTMSLIFSSRRAMNNAELAMSDLIKQQVKLRIREETFKWRVPKRDI